jgi:hypothetical protein
MTDLHLNCPDQRRLLVFGTELPATSTLKLRINCITTLLTSQITAQCVALFTKYASKRDALFPTTEVVKPGA